jgi:hypothetical protein
MASIHSFSFENNELIRNYFNGGGEYTPIAELLYVHTHPLVRPNFVSEIEVIINKAHAVLEHKNAIDNKTGKRLVDWSKELGTLLPCLDESTAPRVLELLRNIYGVCSPIAKLQS